MNIKKIENEDYTLTYSVSEETKERVFEKVINFLMGFEPYMNIHDNISKLDATCFLSELAETIGFEAEWKDD